MNRFAAFILALAVGTATGACASAMGEGSGPGSNRWTRDAESALAMAMLQEGEGAQEQYRDALETALEGLETEPEHAGLWLVLGQAYVGLHDFAGADSAFTNAETYYPEDPAWAEQISVEREQAWIEAYNLGAGALDANDLERAIARFEDANRVYSVRPDAAVLLGWLYTNSGRIDDAIDAYLGALEVLGRGLPEGFDEDLEQEWLDNEEMATFQVADLLTQSGREAEAIEVYGSFLENHPGSMEARVYQSVLMAQEGQAGADQVLADLLTQPDLPEQHRFLVGVGFFQMEDFDRAAEAFRSALEMNPHSRDALYNLAQSLFVQSSDLEEELQELQEADADDAVRIRGELVRIYGEMREATEAVETLDPNNRNVLLLLVRAYRGLTEFGEEGEAQAWQDRALEAISRHDELQFEVLDIDLAVDEEVVNVNGRVQNLTLEQGAQLQLRIILLGEGGNELTSEVVSIPAPAQDQVEQFQTTMQTGAEVKGWKYEAIR
jgi:tetratricopeptide (TPR) repeat protein